MSKIDDAINSLQEDRREAINNSSFTAATVSLSELTTLLNWAVRVREKNPFLVGDRVKLAVDSDPEAGEQPETGVVLGFAGAGALLIKPDTGEYKDTTTGLWYELSSVERIED